MHILREATEDWDQPQLPRGWEGWLVDHTYFTDNSGPVPPHLVSYLNTRYAALAGVSPEWAELVQPTSPFSEQLLQEIDEVAYESCPPALEGDLVLFSMHRCLSALMVSCRTKLLCLAGGWVCQ